MSLFGNIQNSIQELSKSKKTVALYILENWYDVAFSTASNISNQIQVSESVIVRFSQDLGYSGFTELQKELQEIIKYRLVNPPLLESRCEDKEFTTEKVVDQVYKTTQNNLLNTCSYNTYSLFENVVSTILQSNKIVIIARKNSLGPAYILNVALNEMFSNSQVLDGESVDTLDIINGLTKQDLVIFISIPSYSKRMVLYSNYMHEKKTPQIAITNSYSTAFSKNADYTLITSVDSLSFSNSHASTLFLIDTILYLLNLKQKSKMFKYLEQMKLLNKRFNLVEEINMDLD